MDTEQTVPSVGEIPGTPPGERASGRPNRRLVARMAVGSLVEAAADGEQWAWDALVDRFAATVWAIARSYRLNAADAADVSQTTWLRLVEHLGRIEQPERVGAWLATTARRESLRLIRLGARQCAAGDDIVTIPDEAPSSAPDHAVLASERDRLVSELVDQLPTRSRLLLRSLSADTPLSYSEISEALDMPIGSIGPTRARALEQLRRLAVTRSVSLHEIFAS